MSVLSVVQDVCAVVGVQIPTSVFSGINTNRTMQEMRSLANEMAQRICYDTREWNQLKKMYTIFGDGVTGEAIVHSDGRAFDLPLDFKRLLLTANVRRGSVTVTTDTLAPVSSDNTLPTVGGASLALVTPGKTSTITSLWPMRYIPDVDEWIQRRVRNRYDPWGEFTIYQGQMNIWPILNTDQSATFPYLQNACVKTALGKPATSFQADDDTFVLDERLLKLGMIFQWRAQKGAPYAEDATTFAVALATAMGHDKPGPIIVGKLPLMTNAHLAYPFPFPMPPTP
jgi:hypothetical protein